MRRKRRSEAWKRVRGRILARRGVWTESWWDAREKWKREVRGGRREEKVVTESCALVS